MHLSAARVFAFRVPSSVIAKRKTEACIGESVDHLSLEQDDEDLTEAAPDSPEEMKLLKRHMFAEAKNFRELESLIECLDILEPIVEVGKAFIE